MMDSSFSRGKGLLYKIDPRVKITGVFIYALLVATEKDWLSLFYASFFPLIFLCVSRFNKKELGRRLLLVNGFVFILWLILPFSYPGENLFSFGPFSPTKEGVYYCLLITLKSNLILLTTLLLLGTSPIFHIVHGLHHLKIPQRLIHLFYFSYRYIPLIHSEYLRLNQAMKIRGFKPGNRIHTYRSTGYLAGMLFFRGHERSGRVYHAMIARVFQGKFWTLHHFQWKRKDTLISILFSIYFSIFLFLKWL